MRSLPAWKFRRNGRSTVILWIAEILVIEDSADDKGFFRAVNFELARLAVFEISKNIS